MHKKQALSALDALSTERLKLTQLGLCDSKFIFKLTNDPQWLEFIGDRGIVDELCARRYIINSVHVMHETTGFGLLKISTKGGTKVGVCGLMKRHAVDPPDLAFALLPEFRRKGYAIEASKAIINWSVQNKLKFLLAYVLSKNIASKTLLQALSFKYKYSIMQKQELVEVHQRDL